jgi:hypothetical protein
MVKLAALQLRQMAPTSTVSLGLGFGDSFEDFRGGSRPFGEEVPPAEELAVLRGKRLASARHWPGSKSLKLHGKEGVNGSSPLEGFNEMPANRHF